MPARAHTRLAQAGIFEFSASRTVEFAYSRIVKHRDMGIDDIVIFGITIVLFVISGISGARKKRRNSSAGKQRVPREYSEPWGRIESYTVPEKEEYKMREPKTSDPSDYIGEHILAGGTIDRNDIPGEGMTAPPVHTGFRLSGSSSDARKSALNEIMHGFDLEKAVIYSEILKPKFED